MANISKVASNISLVKNSYKKVLALGEGAKADDFRMTFDGYDDLEFLVQATQLPPLKREMVETKGPHGVIFNQQGKYLNAGDVTITFKEVIEGKALEALREIVTEKKYVTIELALISESVTESNYNNSVTLEDSWIEIDAVDLSVDDGTTLVKPAGTIHFNWASYGDDDQTVLGWE